MEFKGTKGKWKAVEYSAKNKVGFSTHGIQFGEDGEYVAEVVHGEANAKLIACSPELLEALEYFCRVVTSQENPSDKLLEAWDRSQKLIKKATEL